ncbi:MAG: ammonia-forming cytochrome c nitrite reductase subunit c552 [Phycisphaeraceae bacterium]|nr:ammonia-forming cytochrome c nitrite reductase subunit c552 [Phycisphaeraceae bacterium]
MSPDAPKQARPWVGWLVFLLTVVGVVAVGLLGTSIMQRRQEARVQPPLTPIAAWETDSSVWGLNFPREYASYKQMQDDTTKTKHGGAFPRDYLEESPTTVLLFSGYAFAKEYRQARGHLYAIQDVTGTKRVDEKTPATCWSCKSPDVPRLMAQMGPEKFYASMFKDLKSEITHPIGCLDCHEPNTMRLRISRPALREAFARQGKDIEQVSHQEMRSLVCAQCHVEYYFKGDGKYLTFPWDKGTSVENMEAYYEEYGFKDWVHAISKTPMLKMQHPDYEVYTKGIHAYRNVACADCHMPYRTEGGAKFTDHHVQSPLLNIANSCAVCHRWGEEEIRTRVEAIQDKVLEGRVRAERAVALAHLDIAACMQAGATDEELKDVRQMVRGAQMRWDYVAANNGMGFHAPQECMRILQAAVDISQECRVTCARILAKHGYTDPVRYPEFDTKEKAQALNLAFIAGQGPDLLGKQAVASEADAAPSAPVSLGLKADLPK